MKRRVLGILAACLMMGACCIPVLAKDTGVLDVAGEKLTSENSEAEITPRALAQSGSFYVNGKRYTCSYKFLWKKSSNSLYYAGISSTTSANTKRAYDLQIVANTTNDGYINYDKSSSQSGTGTLSKYFVTIARSLDTPNYKGVGGFCKFYYGSTMKKNFALSYY